MQNLSLKKLLVAITTLVALVLVIGNIAVWVSHVTLIQAETEKKRSLDASLAFKNVRYHVVQIQQFLTDASAVGEDDYHEAQDEKKAAHLELTRLANLLPEMKAPIAVADQDVDKLYATGERMANAYFHSGREAGNLIMKAPTDGFDAASELLSTRLDKLAQNLEKNVDLASEQQARMSAFMFYSSAGVAGLALVLVIAANAWLARRIFTLLGGEPAYASDIANSIAMGDLATEVHAKEGDSSSLLAQMKYMAGELTKHMREINLVSKQIGQSSYQI